MAAYRLQRHITQAQFAEACGVSKRTVERLEAGESVQLVNLVRALRPRQARRSRPFLPDELANPIDLLGRHGRLAGDAGQPWRWGDET